MSAPEQKEALLGEGAVTVGILASRVRVEEKLLMEAFRTRQTDVVLIDDSELVFDLTAQQQFWGRYQIVLERSLSQSRGMYLLHALAQLGVPTLNRYEVAAVCNDKYLTTAALIRDHIPTPRMLLAFTTEAALLTCCCLTCPHVIRLWAERISE